MPPRDIAILIPAYRPSTTLVGLVKALAPEDWAAVVVVDDGGGPEYPPVFDEVAQLAKVEILRHAVNLGKGAALKTGINAILCDHSDVSGVITVDADGQHDPADVRKVCARFQESPDSLVMGVRAFREEA